MPCCGRTAGACPCCWAWRRISCRRSSRIGGAAPRRADGGASKLSMGMSFEASAGALTAAEKCEHCASKHQSGGNSGRSPARTEPHGGNFGIGGQVVRFGVASRDKEGVNSADAGVTRIVQADIFEAFGFQIIEA